jgi:hypothetical protein
MSVHSNHHDLACRPIHDIGSDNATFTVEVDAPHDRLDAARRPFHDTKSSFNIKLYTIACSNEVLEPHDRLVAARQAISCHQIIFLISGHI